MNEKQVFSEPASSSRVKLLVVTCIALFMAMLDNLVLGVALPSIQQSFHAGVSDLEWFMNAYTLTFSVLLIPFGVLGERYGRKRMFLIGIAIFTLGSLASALSTHALALTLSRALQGAGGAAITPISLTLVNAAFPPRLRAAAIGLWSGISGLGLSVGPLVGGLIINGAPWQMIFWINVPVGIVAIILGLRWLKEATGERRPLDPLGFALLFLSLLGVVFGLLRGNTAGWGTFSVWGPIAGGCALLVPFYLWERGRQHPFVRMSLFRNSRFTAFLLAGFWMNAGIFGAIFLLTLFLQQAQGYSALGAGVREMAWTGVTMMTAPLAGLAVGRFGARAVLLLGLVLQAAALCLIAWLIIANGAVFPFRYVQPAMMMAGAGMGLSFTPLSHGVLSAVTDADAGEASGISNAARELGGVFGIAIGSLVFLHGDAIRTPNEFGDHLVPALFVLAAMIGLAVVSAYALIAMRRHKSASNVIEPASQQPEPA